MTRNADAKAKTGVGKWGSGIPGFAVERDREVMGKLQRGSQKCSCGRAGLPHCQCPLEEQALSSVLWAQAETPGHSEAEASQARKEAPVGRSAEDLHPSGRVTNRLPAMGVLCRSKELLVILDFSVPVAVCDVSALCVDAVVCDFLSSISPLAFPNLGTWSIVVAYKPSMEAAQRLALSQARIYSDPQCRCSPTTDDFWQFATL